MIIERKELVSRSKKIILQEENQAIGRVWIYLIQNDIHSQPYALIEDLFVKEEFRGKGYGTKLLQEAVKEAKSSGCYKIIATSRSERTAVHQLYLDQNFKEYGKEFRLELK